MITPTPRKSSTPDLTPSLLDTLPWALASVGKFIVFLFAIVLGWVLDVISLGYGLKIVHPMDRESYNVLAMLLWLLAIVAIPVVSLVWVLRVNSKAGTTRWDSLMIPLICVPAIAWFTGMIIGVAVKIWG